MFRRQPEAALAAPAGPRGPGRLQRWSRLFPLTLRGASWAGLCLAAFAYGRTRLDLVVTLAGLWGLAAWLIGLLAALLAWAVHGAALKRAGARTLAPLFGLAGVALPTGFSLRARWIPLALRPRVAWFPVVGEASFSWSGAWGREYFAADERCLLEQGVRELEIGDLLGFWRFRPRRPFALSLRVLPDCGAIGPAELAACLAQGDLLPNPWGPARGDLTDFRPYTRSDPARLILWKVFARTRHLVVRSPEPARSLEGRPLVYLVTGGDDEAAAGCALALLESGLLGPEVRFAADGCPAPTADLESAKDAIARSSAFRHRAGRDLALALDHPSSQADDPVIVVGPARPGIWVRQILPLLEANSSRVAVVAAGDAAPPGPAPARWKNLLVHPDPENPAFDTLAAGLLPLTGGAWKALLVDRISGRVRALADGQDRAGEMPRRAS